MRITLITCALNGKMKELMHVRALLFLATQNVACCSGKGPYLKALTFVCNALFKCLSLSAHIYVRAWCIAASCLQPSERHSPPMVMPLMQSNHPRSLSHVMCAFIVLKRVSSISSLTSLPVRPRSSRATPMRIAVESVTQVS